MMSLESYEKLFYKARNIYDSRRNRQMVIEEKISKLEEELEILREDLAANDDALRKSEEAYVEALAAFENAYSRAFAEFASVGLPGRVKNALVRGKVSSLDELKDMSIREVSRIRGIGKDSLDAMEKALADHGIFLKGGKTS